MRARGTKGGEFGSQFIGDEGFEAQVYVSTILVEDSRLRGTSKSPFLHIRRHMHTYSFQRFLAADAAWAARVEVVADWRHISVEEP